MKQFVRKPIPTIPVIDTHEWVEHTIETGRFPVEVENVCAIELVEIEVGATPCCIHSFPDSAVIRIKTPISKMTRYKAHTAFMLEVESYDEWYDSLTVEQMLDLKVRKDADKYFSDLQAVRTLYHSLVVLGLQLGVK